MIKYGNIYIITKDFDGAVSFYKKLFEKDVASQNKNRFAEFWIDGLGVSIMNGKFDKENPAAVEMDGEYLELYDNYERIIEAENCGKVVINLCTDDLKAEHERIKNLGIGSDLTELCYIHAGMPYWYFKFKDIDGNTIEVTGEYKVGG